MPQLTDLELKREIGRSIAEARLRRGLSQKQLAARLGCSEAYILDMEHGRSFPRFRAVAALSRELGVPLRDLVDQVDQPDPGNDRRARLELRGRALLNGLSDEFLEIAIEQLSVLAHRGARSEMG